MAALPLAVSAEPLGEGGGRGFKSLNKRLSDIILFLPCQYHPVFSLRCGESVSIRLF